MGLSWDAGRVRRRLRCDLPEELSLTAPDLSVIVPVLDDEPGIVRTVASLHRQTLAAARYEVLVVDNGSRDGTLESARVAATAGPASVEVLVEDRVRTSYGARNAGIATARGRRLCFVDADVHAPPGYLDAVLRAFDDDGYDYVGSLIEVEVSRPTVAACLNRLTGFPVRHYLEARGWAPTCGLAIRREVIEQVGTFDDRLASGGDVEFGGRVAAAGLRQGLVGDVALAHPARSSVRALVSKTRRTARGKVALARDDAKAAAVVRGYRSWARLRPLTPWWVRAELAGAGIEVSWTKAVGVAALKSALDVVRLATALAAQRSAGQR